jgi:site-specific DNA-methyltransferase (adenine-specific)
MIRVSQNQIIFGGNYFVEHLYNSPCWIVWDKDNSGNFADCELAWTSFKTAVRKIKYRWNGMLQENMKEKEYRFHPTQKPIGLFEWILDNYSEQGMIILDPFLGSGTTAIAAHNTGRFFIGIEKEPKYVEIAQKRLEQAQAQQSLFA